MGDEIDARAVFAGAEEQTCTAACSPSLESTVRSFRSHASLPSSSAISHSYRSALGGSLSGSAVESGGQTLLVGEEHLEPSPLAAWNCAEPYGGSAHPAPCIELDRFARNGVAHIEVPAAVLPSFWSR